MNNTNRPSEAFVLASWVAFLVGVSAFLLGLWNTDMDLNQKGYYFTLLIFGLFSAVSLQKSVRDRLENIPVTGTYFAICWFSFITAVVLLAVGLWNANMILSEKGFYAISFFLSLYASISVQKNIRDTINFPSKDIDLVVVDSENSLD